MIKDIIYKARNKEYYQKLLKILVHNGLLELIDSKITKENINYTKLTIDVIIFLKKNKKHYSNFNSDTFKKILVLSIDEILKNKLNIDLEDDDIDLILELLYNTYLIRSFNKRIKDFFIKTYYKLSCSSCDKEN